MASPTEPPAGFVATSVDPLRYDGQQLEPEESTAMIVNSIPEGARVLEEGYATRAGDIDIIYIYGFGFPRQRGGPMFYADTVGLPKVLASIEKFSKGYMGEVWKPAPLLVKLAKEGRKFNG